MHNSSAAHVVKNCHRSTRLKKPIERSQLIVYSLPAVVVGYMFMLLQVYALKYATDVLLIAPAVIGTIFGLARVWDAFSDPIVGYLSDNTTSRLGRRRIWILGGVVPAGLFYIMLYAGPLDQSPTFSAMWMGIAIFGFYTSMTAISVPHLAMGAETTRDAMGRNQLYGMRHLMIGVGSILGILTLGYITSLDQNDTHTLRNSSLAIAIVASLICTVLVATSVFRFRETNRGTIESQTLKTSGGVYASSVSILRHSEARLLLFVRFIEAIGSGALSAVAIYVAQYVIGIIEIATVAIIAYMLSSTFSIPVWVKISKVTGKVRLWIFAMIGSALSYGGLFSLAFIDNQTLQISVLMVLCVCSGAVSGCAQTLGPSVLSDVIDQDELASGERKEGAYFALYNLADKSAHGVTIMITGLVLTAAGFIPNAEQTFTTKLALCGLLGLLPFACYSVGSVMFSRFTLREQQHAEILRALDARARSIAPVL